VLPRTGQRGFQQKTVAKSRRVAVQRKQAVVQRERVSFVILKQDRRNRCTPMKCTKTAKTMNRLNKKSWLMMQPMDWLEKFYSENLLGI
jgi:hypothetical protein